MLIMNAKDHKIKNLYMKKCILFEKNNKLAFIYREFILLLILPIYSLETLVLVNEFLILVN